jgi:hypothetical protein
VSEDVAAAGQGVGGRTFDLTVFFGSAGLAYVAGVLIMLVPRLVLPLWWAWVLLVEGPHLVATWGRTYFDAEERARTWPLLLGSSMILAIGPAAWLASQALGRAEVFDVFLMGSALWSVHHFVRQNYGMLAVLGRHARSTRAERHIDSLFLYALLWSGYAVFLITNTQNREFVGRPLRLSSAETAIVVLLGGGMLIGVLLYCFALVSRLRRGRRVLPALYALCSAVGVTAFAYLVVGGAEPLVPRPVTMAHRFLGLSLVVGVCHGVQYLGVSAITSARRGERRISGSWWKRAAQRPWASYCCFVLLSVAIWGPLNASSGLAPNLAPLGFDTHITRLCLGVYWSVLLHHFYLDQKIWRLTRDAALRLELNLERADG